MSYIDGFVIAVPRANKEKFIQHAQTADAAILEWGANRILECWEDDVPNGQLTDFRRAVQARDDEAVAFSWIEWPDKTARDAGVEKMMAAMKDDPRFSPENNPIPFDGKRMIFGGFVPVLEINREQA
jgi:uncharacterized protein YbaA (DUF1428 family)